MNVRGGLCDCFGNKISSFAGRSKFTCSRRFMLYFKKNKVLVEVVQSEIKTKVTGTGVEGES